MLETLLKGPLLHLLPALKPTFSGQSLALSYGYGYGIREINNNIDNNIIVVCHYQKHGG